MNESVDQMAPTKARPKVAAAGQLLTVGQVAYKLHAARIDDH